jgi:HAD superfamily hydrolase (TIGR01490 family)
LRTLAVFDFDGTITTKDSFLEFIKFSMGEIKFIWGMIILSPVLILYLLKLYPNDKAKQVVLRYFFAGMSGEKFAQVGLDFANSRIDSILNPNAMDKIQWHRSEGHDLVVVTASVSDWICGWTNKQGLDLIASQLEKKAGKITGRLQGKNCYGIEKVNRLSQSYNLDLYDNIYAYGDSRGDQELFKIASKVFYKRF